MQHFESHTIETAPESSKPLMQGAIDNFGFLPNLIARMASSPAMTEAYLTLGDIFSRSTLSEVEQQIVLLTISRYHKCSYCVSAHSVIAEGYDIPQPVIDAIRKNLDIPDGKLNMLQVFTEHVLQERGWVNDKVLQNFYNAGYNQENALEVIVGIALKTLSNYTNHMVGTELDDCFMHRSWQR